MRRAIRRALRKLGFGAPVFWLVWWFLPEVLDLPSQLLIYDRIDAHADYPSNRRLPSRAKSVQALERALLDRVDLAVSVSPVEDARYHHVPNGVDLEKATSALSGLNDDRVPGPTLVYIGAVDRRVDFGLLGEIGRARPDWTIDIFGTVAPGLPPFPLPSNVRFFGWREHSELLRLAAQRSVGLIPFHLDAFTCSTSPLKLLEYFIAGTPVVGSRLPTLERVAEEIPSGLRLASTPADWVSYVESFLDDAADRNPSARLRRYAESHSVEHRVTRILDLVPKEQSSARHRHGDSSA
jgi:glycosyltransferase involved in cell wall biosynthesis